MSGHIDLDALISDFEATSASLNQDLKIPCALDTRWPPPRTQAYEPAFALSENGLVFRAIELLHAIGTKYSGRVDSNALRVALANAYILEHLDLRTGFPRLLRRPAPDFVSSFSHAIGVGFCCIAASVGWRINWVQLTPIPGRGKRFDFRGLAGTRRAIFEAKGSLYQSNQLNQIKSAREQKAAHQKRQDRADIELIVATRLGKGNENSAIIMADPPFDFDERAFDPAFDEIRVLRHYARVAMFTGQPFFARELLLNAAATESRFTIETFMQPWASPSFGKSIPGDKAQLLPRHEARQVNGRQYYGLIVELETRRGKPIRVFQGVDTTVQAALETGRYDSLRERVGALRGESESVQAQPEVGTASSVFPDGSILQIQL